MTHDLFLRRKWTLKAHGRQVVFIKNQVESTEHVLMKAFLWALYLPQYPEAQVEVRIGDRYKPDIVMLDRMQNLPIFWAEAGHVGQRKIASLTRRFRDTHFAMAKWATNLDPYAEMVERALRQTKRNAPFDLIRFEANSAEKFIAPDGTINITHDDVTWRRLAAK